MIVIGTTPGRENWLHDCLKSIDKPVLILSAFNYELGKIKWCANHLNTNFLFLQDSTIIKNSNWMDDLLNKQMSIALFNDPYIYGTYMGVYEIEVLKQIEIPQPSTKAEAVHFEIAWTKKYVEKAKRVEVAFPEISDAKAKQGYHQGRLNLILENEYLIKYKGDWGQKPLVD